MPEQEARVLVEIDNLAVAGGRPLYLVRDEATMKHALARMLPGATEILQLESKWIDQGRMTEFAYRVAAGDPRALTQPGALQACAIVLLAAAARAEELSTLMLSEQERTKIAAKGPGPIVATPQDAPAGQGMLQLDAVLPKAIRSEARARGFTGDMCVMCSNFTMKRNGTCLVCETCGATNGCS